MRRSDVLDWLATLGVRPTGHAVVEAFGCRPACPPEHCAAYVYVGDTGGRVGLVYTRSGVSWFRRMRDYVQPPFPREAALLVTPDR